MFVEISFDLIFNDREKQGFNGGLIIVENVGVEFYGIVFMIIVLLYIQGIVWVGSDDGVVYVMCNDGESWSNVMLEEFCGVFVNVIEVSFYVLGIVYVMVVGYKFNDFSLYVYKFVDYGVKWKRFDVDFLSDNFICVVCEDLECKGLFYVGGEGGMYVFFDDGDYWQLFEFNLLLVLVMDLMVC